MIGRIFAIALPPLSSILCRPDGPRGSRTHYPSIKSRELILMSFRPPQEFRISNRDFRIGHIAIRNSTFFMLRPRVELGSRTNLVLRGYKPRALPIELPEQNPLRNSPPPMTR